MTKVVSEREVKGPEIFYDRNIWVPPNMLVCCRSYLQEETVIHHLDRLYFAQCNEREGGMATKGAKGGDDSSE